MRSPAALLVGAAAVCGAAAGGLGIALTLLLHFVQHRGFGYDGKPFYDGITGSSGDRRLVCLALAGVVAGAGWWLVRRSGAWVPLERALRGGPLPVRAAYVGAVLQIVTVGLGAPLGREGAPRESAGATARWVAERLKLTPPQQSTLVAAAAGAGLAAVYNVPVGGALFACEVLLRSRRLRDLVLAGITSAIATVVSFAVLPDARTYGIGRLPVTGSLDVFAVVAGPVAGVGGVAFVRLMRRARQQRPPKRLLTALPAAVLTTTACGAIGVALPQLLGNGKGPVEFALTGQLGLATAGALLLLRPLAAAACLRAGIVGGLLTPALATGAVLGLLIGTGWSSLWGGTPTESFVLVVGGAFLAATQRAPLTAIALSIEFTHCSAWFLIPLALATAGATVISRPLLPAAP